MIRASDLPAWTLNPLPCSGRDDDWFPSKSESASSLQVRRAKRACLRCPFQRECLEQCYEPTVRDIVVEYDGFGEPVLKGVLKDSSEEGIWGGTTSAERRAFASVPLPQRIELLLAWVRSDVGSPFSPITKEELAG